VVSWLGRLLRLTELAVEDCELHGTGDRDLSEIETTLDVVGRNLEGASRRAFTERNGLCKRLSIREGVDVSPRADVGLGNGWAGKPRVDGIATLGIIGLALAAAIVAEAPTGTMRPRVTDASTSTPDRSIVACMSLGSVEEHRGDCEAEEEEKRTADELTHKNPSGLHAATTAAR